MSGVAARAKLARRHGGAAMELWIVRHAIAEERSAKVAEGERALTVGGRERFGEIAAALRALGVRLDVVLTSPWRRAVETARLLASLSSGEPEETEHLLGEPGEGLLERIVSARAQRVAVVGHEPWLSELASLLVAGQADAAHVRLKKGGVAQLEGEPVPGGMELVLLLPPKLLRRLA
jgi:phosphohistidine phosphatase